MRIAIKRISRKEVDTKYGRKWKLGIQDAKGTWYSAWANPQTQEWREGQNVEIEVKEREYNGKTYYDVVFPKVNGNASQDTLIKILAIVERIEKRLEASAEPPQHTSEDMPPDQEEIDDSVPF